MSIASLLKHHGVRVPRYVTVSGQIVFDDVEATATGYAHKTLGAVTPVARHTFHGGEEPSDADPIESLEWWDEPGALDRHVEAMKVAFPSFFFLPSEGGAPPYWGGELDTGRGKFKVLVTLRRDRSIPRVDVVEHHLGRSRAGRWIDAPHLYRAGNLCLADRDEWDAESHTVATAVAWAAHWLAAYTEWKISDRWPIDGYQPDVA